MSIMGPKHFAIALTTMATVGVTVALAADADPQAGKDVELRTVVEGSYAGQKPEDYHTRVVTFAPRKGVDTIEVDPRMPFREWSFSEAAFAKNVIPAMFQTESRKLKAHLVGFRGIGYTIDEGEFKGEIEIPTVLLRLPDGRVRLVETTTLSKADLQFAATHHRADSLSDLAYGTKTGGYELVTPHQHLFLSGNRYGFTYFYNTVGEDPSLG
jgi:hypothetical protein